MTITRHPSTCPLDCPAACALLAERDGEGRVGRIRGADSPFNQGVVCAKVARYGERVHSPARLRTPLRRAGDDFKAITWDDGLDLAAEAITQATARFGAESVWPYYYYGTMGLVQSSGLARLGRAAGWSAALKTLCSTQAGAGWTAGTGAKIGVGFGEIEQSDLIVVWGADPAVTQLPLMNRIAKTKAPLIVVDPRRTRTADKAALHLAPRPGTDGALACAVMHGLFRDGFADRDFLEQYTKDAERLEAHLAARTPEWAAAITGVAPEDIESFIRLYGSTKRSWLRAGYGFTRNRDGAANMHAVSCLPAVTGAWAQPGGGALNSMGGAFSGLDRRLLDGPEHSARTLDLCRIGRHGGPPVSVMLVQNANPATIAPDSDWVRGELTRDDLTLIVHEQVMTATAQLADLVFPATTFLEHADLYASYGHGFLQRAKPVIAPVGEARSNHRFIAGLATRLGLDDPSTRMDEEAMIDAVLAASGLDFGGATWLDLSPDFDAAHFRHGFGHPDGRFHFATPWSDLPDHHGTIDAPTPDRPLRLITPPSIHFLNSTFGDSPTQRRLAGRPTVDIHPADALGVFDGDVVRLGNDRASVRLHARVTETVAPGVVSVEGLWPGDAFLDGIGINRLTSSDSIAPNGGAPYHDTAVWLKRDP